MYFIPLTQIESVELVIHALKAAGGQADCSSCPVRKVCMKQCLTIADAVASMAQAGTLPSLGEEEQEAPLQEEVQVVSPAPATPVARGGLRVVK